MQKLSPHTSSTQAGEPCAKDIKHLAPGKVYNSVAHKSPGTACSPHCSESLSVPHFDSYGQHRRCGVYRPPKRSTVKMPNVEPGEPHSPLERVMSPTWTAEQVYSSIRMPGQGNVDSILNQFRFFFFLGFQEAKFNLFAFLETTLVLHDSKLHQAWTPQLTGDQWTMNMCFHCQLAKSMIVQDTGTQGNKWY